MRKRETVVFVHGIWMTGVELALLRRRVRRYGFTTRQFHYHSLRRTPRANAADLNRFLKNIDADVIHLVAHSLGGIVVLHLFDAFPEQKPGRVLLLGTPVRGSIVAQQMSGNRLLRPLLGRSTEFGLLGDSPSWPVTRELGVIAGTRQLGIGMLLTRGRLERPNDGTVAVSRTRLEGMSDFLQLPYTHLTLLWASPVARAVCQFLKTGKFAAAD